jgi:hypothetical protein
MSGLDVKACLDDAIDRDYRQHAIGVAWATHRDLVTGLGLYDAGILGSGDRAMMSACFGCFDHVQRHNAMHSTEAAYYMNWAEPFRVDKIPLLWPLQPPGK